MAGYPPSYPPPAGPPTGFTPKQQARAARQQMKAARAQYKQQARAAVLAAKAQRDLYRAQTRQYRRGSILGPVIILGIGVIILLVRLGRVPAGSFLLWYGHWWPLLLVGAGVVLVAEWAFDQMPRADGTPYVRRGLGGGAIFLLLALALTGAALHGVRDANSLDRNFFLSHLSINPDNIDEIFGEKHEMTQTVDAAFPAGSSLTIDNPHGDVTITGKSADDQVHVIANLEVYTESDSDAQTKTQQLTPRISREGSVVTVTVPAIHGASSDLSITVPDFGETIVNANHGDIAISSLRAPVTLTANHGDIELNSLTGAVNARINHGDATFTAHNITGNINLQGHAEDITISDVTGQTSLEGEFLGDIHLEHLGGLVSFRSNRTQLTLARLNGQLDISPKSDLTGSEIVGPTSLHTRSRNISFERIAGDLNISNSDGSVEITAAPTLGNITIDDRNGEINLSVPDQAPFSIDAETRGGEINSDLDLKPTSDDKTATLRGQVGTGGPHISIHTTHLDINIHKKTEPQIPPPPPPAAKPRT